MGLLRFPLADESDRPPIARTFQNFTEAVFVELRPENLITAHARHFRRAPLDLGSPAEAEFPGP
jgi:hypothetical protein